MVHELWCSRRSILRTFHKPPVPSKPFQWFGITRKVIIAFLSQNERLTEAIIPLGCLLSLRQSSGSIFCLHPPISRISRTVEATVICTSRVSNTTERDETADCEKGLST